MDTTSNLDARFYPEVGFGGFTHRDATIEFFTRIAALLRPDDRVLDFGAGRGGQIATDPVPHRRALQMLKGRCAELVGCDVDPVVLENPFVDRAVVLTPGAALPFADASFDLIYSNYVFEHVDDPAAVAAELLRVTKPGGYICAVTPNRWGYVAIAASLVRNRHHVRLLRRIQPGRHEIDVFPTRYRLNTPAVLRRHFGRGADVVAYPFTPEPAYHFGSPALYRLLGALHKHLPDRLAVSLLMFARKR